MNSLSKVQCVILAGGLGTRISEETTVKPKPMIELGGKPILWHILKTYSHYGVEDFIVCCGYKGYLIKEYFANYFLHNSDVTFDLSNNNQIEIHRQTREKWKVTLVDTGHHTLTGGRLSRIKQFLRDGPFFMTYGDGVGDIDVRGLFNRHLEHGKPATVTAVQPPGRFGALKIDNEYVTEFLEKVDYADSWINGGFFVLSPEVLDLIDGDFISFEDTVLPILANQGDLCAFKHYGFWRPMDTMRDKVLLDSLCAEGKAPWEVWL